MLHARIFSDSVSFVDISNFRIEGMRVTVTPGWQYAPCDVAVMYGLANPSRRSRQGLLRNAIYREHKGPIVVVESCLVGRAFKKRLPGWLAALRRRPLRPRQSHPYFRLAIGGALGDDADFCASNSPADRWEKLKSELGISLKPYRTKGSHVLLIGQIPKDASLRGIDMKKWLPQTAALIRQVSDRPILVRMHPSMRWKDREVTVAALSEIPGVRIAAAGRSFGDDSLDAWTCVTLSSGAAIDALIDGIPPICLSPASLAYGICSNSLDYIDNPLEPEREQFLRDIAYSQWTLAELGDGTAWRHISAAVARELKSAGVEGDPGALSTLARTETGLPKGRPAKRSSASATGLRQACFSTLLAKWATAHLKLGRYAQAERLFFRLCILRPDCQTAHEGLAHAAEKLGNWDIAASAWATVGRIEPERLAPLSRRAAALMKLGVMDEAGRSYRLMQERFPQEVGGFRGLERVAGERGDWALAMQMQDAIWTRFGDPDALRRKVLLLIRLKRMDEAHCVVRAVRANSYSLAYLLAAVPLLEADHDWAEMQALLSAHESIILKNWQLLSAWVSMMGRLGQAKEGLNLLDRSHAGNHAQRRRLLISSLIQAREYGQAATKLDEIRREAIIDEFAPELLAPMVSAAWDTGGGRLARNVIDRVEREAPATVPGKVQRLLAVFLRARVASLESLTSSLVGSQSLPPPEERIRRLPTLHFAGERTRQQEAAIAGICATFGQLRDSRSAFFPDSSFVANDALEIALRLVQAKDQRRPLSLIRLGDGEGSLLPYGEEFAKFQHADSEATIATWWGKQACADAHLVQQLQEAIRSADIVGFPDMERTCRGVLNAPPQAIGDSGRNTRGLLASIDYVARRVQDSVTLTSCHIHQSFSYWGLWDLLLPRFGGVSLITCHPALGRILAERHGVHMHEVHLVPPEQKYATGFVGALAKGNHYPETFERLRMNLDRPSTGRVFLVSAGVLGKIYCMWIRQAGGIAIDIGSAADYWCGYATRSVADISTYRTPAGVMDAMRNFVANHPRYREILPFATVGSAA